MSFETLTVDFLCFIFLVTDLEIFQFINPAHISIFTTFSLHLFFSGINAGFQLPLTAAGCSGVVFSGCEGVLVILLHAVIQLCFSPKAAEAEVCDLITVMWFGSNITQQTAKKDLAEDTWKKGGAQRFQLERPNKLSSSGELV